MAVATVRAGQLRLQEVGGSVLPDSRDLRLDEAVPGVAAPRGRAFRTVLVLAAGAKLFWM